MIQLDQGGIDAASARARARSRLARPLLPLAILGNLLGGAALAGCDPRVTSHPADRGPAPGPIGPSAAFGDEGWKPPSMPAMAGMGSMGPGATAPGASMDGPLPEAIATGDGRGLPSEGPALYTIACAKCHGESGRGDGPMAGMASPGDLTSAAMHARLSDDQMARLIVHGRKKMPAFGPSITMDQLRVLVLHVRTLKSP